jgi:molecular chaperone DnaK
LIYSTEKSIKDLGDKVDSDTKTKVEESIAALRKAMEGEDAAEITRVSEELTQASHKLAEAMYQQASQNEQQAGAGAESTEQAAGGAGAADEDVVDADFEEVKDEDKK